LKFVTASAHPLGRSVQSLSSVGKTHRLGQLQCAGTAFYLLDDFARNRAQPFKEVS
jgi:hypothetical protein